MNGYDGLPKLGLNGCVLWVELGLQTEVRSKSVRAGEDYIPLLVVANQDDRKWLESITRL